MRMRPLLGALTLTFAGLAQTPPPPAAGNVTLPLEEYNRLIELGGAPPKKSDRAPYPYVVKSAHMNLQVNGEFVSGNILLEGEVFAPGQYRVPLVAGMVVFDARQQGRELAIEQDGRAHTAVLSGPSEFAVTLEAGLPLTIETGRASLSLPVPMAGAAWLTLSVPGERTLVNLSQGLITSRASKDGRTTIEATLVPGQATNVWWAARLSAPPTPAAPTVIRFLSDVKTLISVSEAEIAIAALAEVTVVQGAPAEFQVDAPEGYELTGATGPTLESSEVQPKGVVLRVHAADSRSRSHQFLISFAKAGLAAKAEVPLISFHGTQRETGEVLVEGEGTIELTAAERGGLRRMDLKETSPYLRSLARAPLHAAFRYQKKPAETPALALEWVRFPDSSVLSAVAQQAVVTTLVTTEGQSLTEVKLTVKNHGQPFLKVALAAGASILSCEVSGEKVKPAQGADGSRVPLLRPGLESAGSYAVSFVFQHAGAPFQKKGGTELTLPRMDVPIGLVEWEVFLPQRYKVTDFGGDAISAGLFPPRVEDREEPAVVPELPVTGRYVTPGILLPGQVGGLVIDPAGAVIPRARVSVLNLSTKATAGATTDQNGRWMVANVPSGRIRITVAATGFRTTFREIDHDAGRGSQLNVALEIGALTETVTVTASSVGAESQQAERKARQNAAPADLSASANVMDLQRRVVGVLPIAVNVPRTGSSYRFVRPLVVDEETTLTFSYRSLR